MSSVPTKNFSTWMQPWLMLVMVVMLITYVVMEARR